MMMVISKYTKFPDKKRTTTSMWFSFFLDGIASNIVRLRNKKARIRLRAFLFLNNPETFGCVVKAWMVQMAVRGVPPSSILHIVHEDIQKHKKKNAEKYKKKIIQNLADFAY